MMRSHSKKLAVAALIVSSLGLGLLFAGPKDKEPKKEIESTAKKLMTDKLVQAQTILEGLALGDFDKIRKSAENLVAISRKAQWFVLKTEKYELFSNEFRRTLETIQEKAKEKNLDGATLAFVELSMTCVKCHKYAREEVRTFLPDDLRGHDRKTLRGE